MAVAIDFSDPALPPGFDAEKIHAGIAVAMQQMAERGWHADLCLVEPDETARIALERQPIAFNTPPQDTADAVARWLKAE